MHSRPQHTTKPRSPQQSAGRKPTHHLQQYPGEMVRGHVPASPAAGVPCTAKAESSCGASLAAVAAAAAQAVCASARSAFAAWVESTACAWPCARCRTSGLMKVGAVGPDGGPLGGKEIKVPPSPACRAQRRAWGSGQWHTLLGRRLGQCSVPRRAAPGAGRRPAGAIVFGLFWGAAV